MNLLLHRPLHNDAAHIRARIFNVLPAASYQMEKLCGLLDIAFSDQTETACVECTATPRLLLNRQFIEEHCANDGDLFLLILHELHHIILGHTRLFPRVTKIDNIVFDAVINSMLARSVGRTVGTGLFTKFYSYDDFPHRLLRPPPGWPGPFEDALANLPPAEARIIRLLYGPDDQSLTYLDIYELLRKELRPSPDGSAPVPIGEIQNNDDAHAPQSEAAFPSSNPTEPGSQNNAPVKDVPLLGNHSDSHTDSPLLTQTVRQIVEGWPPPPVRIAGRDEGRDASLLSNHFAKNSSTPFRKAFAQTLRRCGIHCGRGPATYKPHLAPIDHVVESVLPQGRDRRIPALRALTGSAPILYRSHEQTSRIRLQPTPIVHLYLDVSGSMHQLLPHLLAVCREPFRRGELKVFAFSTIIDELTGRDIATAKIKSTGGTCINAVASHLLNIKPSKRPRVALIATDGYVGKPRPDLTAQIRKVRVVAALTHPAYRSDLEGWAKEIICLPEA